MFEYISNALGIVGSFIFSAISGLVSGIVVFVTRIVDALGGFTNFLDAVVTGISKLVKNFSSLVSSMFPFIPAEWVAIIIAGILFSVVGMIIKKKVL